VTRHLAPRIPLGNRVELPNPLREQRIAACRNGWPIIPCELKNDVPKNWPRMKNDEAAIANDPEWKKFKGTGILVKATIAVLDSDITIPEIAEAALDLTYEIDEAAAGNCILRHSGASTFAQFYQCDKPFGKRATHKYTAHPERLAAWLEAVAMPVSTIEERATRAKLLKSAWLELEAQHVELYGPESKGRYFAYEGPHSPGRDYRCDPVDFNPSTARVDEMPYLPLGPGEIIDRFDALLGSRLTRIPNTAPILAEVLYDLKPESTFILEDGTEETVASLMARLTPGAEQGEAGCMDWVSWAISKSRAHANAFITAKQHMFCITDWSNNGVKHYLESDSPAAADTEALAAALRVIGEAEARGEVPPPDDIEELCHADLVGHSPTGKFIYRPTGKLWPSITVDKRLGKVPLAAVDEDGKQIKMPSSTFIMKTNVVEDMSWMPGEPEIIEDIVVLEGGRQEKKGARIYNIYRPAIVDPGKPREATRWIDHVHMVYDEPGVAEHILTYLAHVTQLPGAKINHALLLGGAPGIGKDTILTPLRYAVGPWNFADVRPSDLSGKFTGWQQAVVLRINEMHDLGESNMYALYERLKPVIATPPETLRVNEKYVGEYYIPNVVKVIATTNYLQNGIYLPPEDRRNFVAWSKLAANAPGENYFNGLHEWLEREGNRHVTAWLHSVDISRFNASAPPVKTAAFWSIVNANRSPTDTGIGDLLEAMKEAAEGVYPSILTLWDLQVHAARRHNRDVFDWLSDAKYRRQIPGTLERQGYVVVANPNVDDGRWWFEKRNQVVYRHNLVDAAVAMQLVKERSERNQVDELGEKMRDAFYKVGKQR
jgi:hypothetical protein